MVAGMSVTSTLPPGDLRLQKEGKHIYNGGLSITTGFQYELL